MNRANLIELENKLLIKRPPIRSKIGVIISHPAGSENKQSISIESGTLLNTFFFRGITGSTDVMSGKVFHNFLKVNNWGNLGFLKNSIRALNTTKHVIKNLIVVITVIDLISLCNDYLVSLIENNGKRKTGGPLARKALPPVFYFIYFFYLSGWSARYNFRFDVTSRSKRITVDCILVV